jgi:ribonuclease HII
MKKLHNKFPIYNWSKNKGYFDRTHLKAILKNGICDFHRKNYEPIKSLVKEDCDRKKIEEKYKKFLA